ncbi:SsrA-binding protein SmpB [Facklamia hominis]|uniref:SsrA-binding protein n=1 Tax=Facklamia hominis CCUG 36813 TaxID=883111 RepID=K1LTN1_9LACT|nr:SsrA-binding protein SmpB [Facklamia hominis]EKB53408.1 SsrA-binding protein [Facklamia hominis CCUG 36813]PKY93239.1 SsrA-binding protein SmpB [Facklamia hominis]RYC97932.1 SsrA-binding protein SmpB [Facklamia hominis]WPJ90202.1 SsrA-binding protein SmpB [Facklamia hominis]
MAKENKAMTKPLAQNRKARHDYEIIDTYEAGMVLKGTEIKSIRRGKMNIQDGFISIYGGQAWLKNVHISPYDHGNLFNHDPLRERKLLLHKKQINDLQQAIKERGMTLVPLKVYLVRGRAKILIGLARGKNLYDKRHALKEKQANRDIERALKNYR